MNKIRRNLYKIAISIQCPVTYKINFVSSKAMEAASKSTEDLTDLDFFNNIRVAIEKELDKMKKIVNNVNQMRVEAAYLESDLLLMIDAPTWTEISELIGPAPMKIDDLAVKKEPQ